jgi:cyclopropane-fatty-acyl-phospholipid synthase
MNAATTLIDRGLVPDPMIRAGIRRLLRERLRKEDQRNNGARGEALASMLAEMRNGPIAVAADKANEQHYEVPAAFFEAVLGRRLKYSSAYWPEGLTDLDAAEEAMLDLTCRRAGVEDGMEILDLGCGWGSLSLWIAERYPSCKVLAVSNSESQQAFIRAQALRHGLENLDVLTADMNDFTSERRFDKIVSIEMFEHMRNVEALLGRVASWLRPEGRLFVHVFCHRRYAYFFETDNDNDWMARHFFTGGYMPSDDLLLEFQQDLKIEQRWRVDGRHYEKTLRAWLRKMDGARDEVMRIFRDAYGDDQAATWFRRWRVFFLACAELFGFNAGQEWSVGHYLFAPRSAASRQRAQGEPS